MRKVLLVCLALVFLACGFGIAADKGPDGKSLLEERCSVCHSADRPKSKKKTPEQWEATVSRMMSKGARLSAEEKEVLVKYLAETYKP